MCNVPVVLRKDILLNTVKVIERVNIKMRFGDSSHEITAGWKDLHDQAFISVDDHMTRAIDFVYDDRHPVMKKLSEESKIELVKCMVNNATKQWDTASKSVMMQRALPKND